MCPNNSNEAVSPIAKRWSNGFFPGMHPAGQCVIWLGILPEAGNPYPKNPNPYPKNPNPKCPTTISGSKLRYPKLLRVIRVLNPNSGIKSQCPKYPKTRSAPYQNLSQKQIWPTTAQSLYGYPPPTQPYPLYCLLLPDLVPNPHPSHPRRRRLRDLHVTAPPQIASGWRACRGAAVTGRPAVSASRRRAAAAAGARRRAAT